MIIEIGHFALILALFVALTQAVIPLIGAARSSVTWMAIGKGAARVQFGLILLAFATLMWAYITSDFSVLNVAQNSHTDKPLIYKISGVWGNHEGSMLLWVLILALYGFALSIFGKGLFFVLQTRALAIQGLISFGFLLYILLASNPFLRLDPPPLNGQGLNPLLQDPGLAFHPPLLYLGYVGFSMAFSFAIAGLIEGQIDTAWARWVRPWTLAAWSFLTLGIVMGAWWAYYTLGWGGWWYWDPVENASFMPWLTGTALIHSLIVLETRGILKAWTLLLAIITFSLALIGTFLVRSGVLTSVHSFASDPKRGVFILVLLGVLIGGALMLFLLRAPVLKGGGFFAPISREGALLLNNMLLASAASSILLGTLYPLFMDAFGLGKISVGPPYFNIIFMPLMIPLLIVMAAGPLLQWKRGDLKGTLQRLKFAAAAVIVVTVGTWLSAGGSARALAAAGGFGLAAWLFTGTLTPLVETFCYKRPLPRGSYGMIIAHVGLAIVLAGVTGSLAWKTEKVQIMHTGESVDVAGYRMTLKSVTDHIQGPNYIATRADFVASKSGSFIAEMKPEHRVFAVPPQPVTNVAIHTNFLSDLYAVIGEPADKGGYVTRFYHTPLVPWIFLGAIVMALGGFSSLTYHRRAINISVKTNAPVSTKEKKFSRNRLAPIPLAVFALLAGFFAWRLALIEQGQTPEIIPSALIGKPAPVFTLPPLITGVPGLKTADLKGKVTLVNFFASWCVPCRAEHPVLATLKNIQGLTLVGVDYEDKTDATQAWLKKAGNPYAALASDHDGHTGIDFGITGVPESYLIDQQGIVRFKQTGPLTPEIVQTQILPLAAELNK